MPMFLWVKRLLLAASLLASGNSTILCSGSDLGIHGIDHLKHKGSFGTLHTDGATELRMTQATWAREKDHLKAGPSDQRLN